MCIPTACGCVNIVKTFEKKSVKTAKRGTSLVTGENRICKRTRAKDILMSNEVEQQLYRTSV